MKKYQPQEIEQKWYQIWEDKGYFAPSGKGRPFSIAIPPPNVTGTLHMGHAFQHSLVDSLIRWRRMRGHDTLWQMGTDHAGISTQIIVSEQLERQQIKPSDIGREKFLEHAWEWKEQSGGTISRQLRRLGASLHWETERFTMDDGMCRAVLEVFTRLYDEGLIYRGKRLVNWDPVLKTSISDLEVESIDEEGSLWHIRYPLADNPEESVVVATTRPETMLGDAAVAVHPDDDRYKHLVGKSVTLPLTDRTIPIIADHYVDSEFGSGCVKITPAHDFNDYDVGTRHDLPLINIFTEGASVNENAPEAYRGMDRFVARKQIVADLEAAGLMVEIEPHKMAVPKGEKTGAVVEPFLSDQWFVKIDSLAEPAIRVVEEGEIEFIPKNYENNYFAWMRDIQDWCISRQQWWGHQIPAWYDEVGNVYVARSVEEAREKYGLADELTLTRDEDVLDTWFSSALWTFATLGWPDETETLEKYHPTDVMVTGHDIITFWVSRMIMMTLKFIGEVPFRKVYITGLVTDAEGQKMSKSKGNGLDPLDIIDGISADDLVDKRTRDLLQPRMAERIEKATRKEFPDGISAYGTDALRFTFYSIATRSRTIRFDMNRVEGYRNFCNKLWNASNFVFMNTEDFDADGEREFSVIDRWVHAELENTINAVNRAMETYRFDLAAREVYEFVWDELCDWYVELCKPLLYSEESTPAQRRGAQATLLEVLESTLRLAHPFLPFMTEEIWQQIPDSIRGDFPTIMTRPYPEENASRRNDEAVADVSWLKQVVTGSRNIRGEMDISFSKEIPVMFHNGSEDDRQRVNEYTSLLKFLIKPESLTWLEPGDEIPVAATHLVGDMQVLVPMSGLIDKDAEIARLDKEIDRKTKDRDRTSNKLGNPNFVEKAPDDVVQKERDKLTELESALEKLESQKARVATL